MTENQKNRRPLATRSSRWAQALAKNLAQRSIPTPNQISLLSIVFALFGGLLLAFSPNAVGLILAALFIQLRLLCNLLDGMVAVEGGKKTANGVLYNEIPDRIADSVLILAFAAAVGQPWLGWLGALLAALSAYIRLLGGSLGLEQRFSGPMAKPHRMALLTAACLIGAVEWQLWHSQYALWLALLLLNVGTLLTCVLRTRAISRELETQARST
ncbi:CDP-alcohol phosphatidyltransferase family protein [Testudinibacter sp. TR-2022]|uniref:CDP-alcohol phosphatidyltransferase family protein n=1 Tax=Testudinibacter sp. TR-2022 TaxID=2585029 RepID=UPI001119E03D|nr:CDP-alcohol phosphatidyltransferase family protein [Testudinibacter sp. TR-2022]TNH06456.1 CDP-alcohol phosphatidyltransferase family protein [Pasteurellaceae bacterium Phil11]TNH24805.1 CDP-alcohol phosphatidyltransferase family protein [Testudinibacter sp. TR-2022]TNH29240.1 CDP-alcohol phosphatidyltransferase family protein [Testudinibacter sp. TR-2022]